MISVDELEGWLKARAETPSPSNHPVMVFCEDSVFRSANIEKICGSVRDHYVDCETTADRLEALGASKTAALLREDLPTSKKSRSGDLGEILATEVAEKLFAWKIPIRRLRWKDGREMALRGDDLIAIKTAESGQIRFLKAESKSRASLTQSVIKTASESLDRERGFPTRHSVLFVAKRLREGGNRELALKLEGLVVESYKGSSVEHLVFFFSGNDPEGLLKTHRDTITTRGIKKNHVGVWASDHQEMIKQIFEEL